MLRRECQSASSKSAWCRRKGPSTSKHRRSRTCLACLLARSSVWRNRTTIFHCTARAYKADCEAFLSDRSRKPRQSRLGATTVFLATPVMRTVARIEFPSTREAITWLCFTALILFIFVRLELIVKAQYVYNNRQLGLQC